MNNYINNITKGDAIQCRNYIRLACNNPSAKKEILRGGGNSGGPMTNLLMNRKFTKKRISENALKICLNNNISPLDFFMLTSQQVRKKHGNFFSSNEKDIKKAHNVGQYITADHNIPNKEVIKQMLDLCNENQNADESEYEKILNLQSYDLITLEENKKINDHGFQSSGSKETRDSFCSSKIEFIDIWLTPTDVIDKFFEITKLNKNECLDPCASDGRWLNGQGLSMDILPTKKHVTKQDFLKFTKEKLPPEIKTIVGCPPSSLLKEFITHSLELVDDCYLLVENNTVFQDFSDNIKDIYIFDGLEGEQKDNRSRCEFDFIDLKKSSLWCSIVHITKEKQPKWTIESNISDNEKIDGYHVALNENLFLKSNIEINKNKRITKISVNKIIK